MRRIRLLYLLISIAVIACGLLSRQLSFLPIWFGDLLYAIMLYFLLCSIAPKRPSVHITLITIIICFLIECSHLSDAGWLVWLRSFTLGKLVLGQGFQLIDLPAYMAGGIFAELADCYLIRDREPFYTRR